MSVDLLITVTTRLSLDIRCWGVHSHDCSRPFCATYRRQNIYLSLFLSPNLQILDCKILIICLSCTSGLKLSNKKGVCSCLWKSHRAKRGTLTDSGPTDSWDSASSSCSWRACCTPARSAPGTLWSSSRSTQREETIDKTGGWLIQALYFRRNRECRIVRKKHASKYIVLFDNDD